MFFTAIFWLQLFLLSSTSTAKTLTVPRYLQALQVSNNETINTATFENPPLNVFFTNARNVTTTESVSVPTSQRLGFNSSIAPLTDLVKYDVVDSNPPLEMDCK